MASFDRSYDIGCSYECGCRHREARHRSLDRRARLELEPHRLETHFHSLTEQQAITWGSLPILDVDLERRLDTGQFHHA